MVDKCVGGPRDCRHEDDSAIGAWSVTRVDGSVANDSQLLSMERNQQTSQQTSHRHARPHSSPFGQRALYSPFTALIVFRHRSNQTPRSATDDAAPNLFLVARFCCCCHFPLGYFRDAIWMFVLWTSSLVPHNTVDIKQS